MSLVNKRIFVSGGAGVIGSELCPMLTSLGAIVMVGDLKPRPHEWESTIIYRQSDLNFITKEEIENFHPEIFIHLAATFERSTETYSFWEENFVHNISLSHHLMSLMKDLPSLQRVVFASSYLIYDPDLYTFGSPQSSPVILKESDAIHPRNLTGMAKLAHEVELRFLENFKRDSVSFAIARIFRGYGKGSRCIISRWIRSLLNNEEISVYRKEGLFDYIYAEDTALGLLKLAEHDEIKGIINLGTGKARRVSDIIEILKNRFPEMKYKEIDSNIPFEASQADMSRFEKEIGWVPSRNLEDTIPEIIEFEKTNHAPEPEPFNVLVTSISKKVPLLKAVRKACAKIRPDVQLFGGDVNPDCIGRHFVDLFWQMPVTEELTINIVLGFCRKHNIKAIIPTREQC
jgi:carbamoyl-phosphate synthase large subunit